MNAWNLELFILGNNKIKAELSCFVPVFAGGTSVSGALLCPENETRMIVSLDTSQMVSVWRNLFMFTCILSLKCNQIMGNWYRLATITLITIYMKVLCYTSDGM